jgi:hypothetical protein
VPQNSKSKDPTLLETHTFDVSRILETWKFAVSFLHGDRLERLERSEAVERLERLERAFRLPESVALSFSPINALRWSHPVQVFR